MAHLATQWLLRWLLDRLRGLRDGTRRLVLLGHRPEHAVLVLIIHIFKISLYAKSLRHWLDKSWAPALVPRGMPRVRKVRIMLKSG